MNIYQVIYYLCTFLYVYFNKTLTLEKQYYAYNQNNLLNISSAKGEERQEKKSESKTEIEERNMNLISLEQYILDFIMGTNSPFKLISLKLISTL